MSLRKRRHFSRDIKLRIVKETHQSSVVAVARRHNLSPKLISRWRSEFEGLGDHAFPGNGNATDTVANRMKELERQNERLNQENSFLKKVLDAFEKEHPSSGGGDLA